jgi:hypothetical protein
MAVTVTTVRAGTLQYVADVEASADADTTATLAHGLGVAPEQVVITPLLAAAYTAQWRVTSFGATNVVLTKGTGVGSGATGSQIRVTVIRPHSIVA